MSDLDPLWQPQYEAWRHGGWYVTNVRYPSGAVGCVSRNYADRKWRIVCDERPFNERPTFRTRDDAARAERELATRSASGMSDVSNYDGLSLKVHVEGKSFHDLGVALEEVLGLVRRGVRSGLDSTEDDTGGYSFGVIGEEVEDD